MPNALADALVARLRDAFPPVRAYPPDVFEQPPMPPLVAHFLTTHLQYRVRHEVRQAAPPASPWLDAGHETVQHAWRDLADVLEQHGQYPPEAWETWLRDAVEHVLAFLVRPRATLATAIFSEAEAAQPATTVMQHLNAFAAYGYLREGVRMHLQKEQLREIDRPHFEALLHRIDEQVTRDYDADAWLNLLAPLFELIRQNRPEADVPVWAIRAFFRDKEDDALVHRLDTMQEQRGLSTLDEAALRALIAAPEEEPETLAEEAAPDEPEPAPLPTSAPAAGAPATPAEAATPSGPVPLWKQFQQTQSPATPAPSRRTEMAPPPATKTAVPRWKQFRAYGPPATVTSSTPASPAPPASTEEAILGEAAAERARFIDGLFLGNEAHYTAVLHRLAEAPDWAVASRLIAEEVFQKNQVDIYSDTAVRFTDAVQAYFA